MRMHDYVTSVVLLLASGCSDFASASPTPDAGADGSWPMTDRDGAAEPDREPDAESGIDADASAPRDLDAGAMHEDSGAASFVVCPQSLEPTYPSIDRLVFKRSCGTEGTTCHSSEGAIYSGGLDLESDAWAQLLGPAGTGEPANNIEGSAGDLLRVLPGDAAASFLLIKLQTIVPNDPEYGSGMPFGAPGSVCPEAVRAVSQWINAGASRQ